MVRLGLTYDMRSPVFAASALSEQYSAMLEQAEYADRNGFESLAFNEHHGSDDGYIPSPLVATAAAAARTSRLTLRPLVAVPFYEPLKLAEDLAVVDQISGGRLTPVLGTGYRAAEFEMFGADISSRRATLGETIDVLRQAWTGEPFEYRGRTVRVMPRPAQVPGPPILLGGMSKAAAMMAARLADGFFPVGTRWWDLYREECAALGKPDPGPPPHGGPMFVHVTHDPERDWPELAPYLLSAIELYRRWALESVSTFGPVPAPFAVTNEAELRANEHYCIVTPDEAVELLDGMGDDGVLIMRPMWGGYSPELAWSSLELLVGNVIPRTTAGAETHPSP